MLRRGDTWFAGVGAIHGLPVGSRADLDFQIYTADDAEQLVGKGRITAVGAQRSQFEITAGGPLDTGRPYQMELRYMPQPPLSIRCQTYDTALERLLKERNLEASVNFDRTSAVTDSDLELRTSPEHYHLYRSSDGRFLTKAPVTDQGRSHLAEALGKILKWQRILPFAERAVDLTLSPRTVGR